MIMNISISLNQQENANNNTTNDHAALLADIDTMLWHTVPALLLVLGLFGNVLTIVVMQGLIAVQSTSCIAFYFIYLASSDLVLLLSTVIWNLLLLYRLQLNYYDAVCTVPFFLSYVSSLTSAWFLVVMTFQRVTSVVLPHRVQVLCTVKRGKIVVAVIFVVACALNVNIFLNYHTRRSGVGERYVCQSIDDHLASTFLSLDLVMASVLPFIFLVAGNAILIHRVLISRRFSQKMMSDQTGMAKCSSRSGLVSSVTVTLILTSLAFCLLTLPTCIVVIYLEEVGFYEGDIVDEVLSAKLSILETTTQMMWIGNSAVNFYIYILSGSKFRNEVMQRLCPSRQIIRTRHTAPFK